MKKLQQTLILITFIIFSSCINNNANVDISDDDLIGTWNLIELKSENGTITVIGNATTETVDFGFEGSNFNTTITFEHNPNVVTGSGNFSISYTAYSQGQTQTVQETVVLSNTHNNMIGSDWDLEDGVITFFRHGEEVHAEVIEFDETILRLKMVLDQNVNYNNVAGGNISGNIYITLSK